MSYYSPPPPPPYQPPGGRTSSGVVIAVGVMLAVIIVAVATGLGIFVNHARSGGSQAAQASPTPSSGALTPTSGALVFEDGFHDSLSGWSTGPVDSGTTYSYAAGGYQVQAKGNFDYFSESPYQVPKPQLSATVIASQSKGALTDTGFGVTFTSGTATSQVRYEFLVLATGDFLVERTVGTDAANNVPNVLKQGSSPASANGQSLTLVGACITSADGQTTRLVMFVNGSLVADLKDPNPASLDGWVGGLDVASSDAGTSTVTATRFEEHDLSR